MTSDGSTNSRATSWLRPDSLSDSVAILLSLTAVQRLLGFGRSVLFCMWLSPAELGQWDLAFGFLMLAAPIAVLSLPGAFGRYVQYYDHRGQLRTFLKRTSIAVVVMAAIALLTIVLLRDWFSQLIFGRPDRVALVLLLALSLMAVIAYNFVLELFMSLRLQRLSSAMEFTSSLGFAILGVGLLATWKTTAESVIVAYGAASLLAMLLSLRWVVRSWHARPAPVEIPSQTMFWAKLVPFVAWVWVSNWLGHLFTIVDRYMIVHYSGLSSDDSLALVGQYHSSRIVPFLLVTVSSLVATTITPFLSHDWEAGRRDQVRSRLNTLVKLVGLTLLAGAVVVQVAVPLLFDILLRGKFDVGMNILSWTLMFSVWFGMTCIAKTWLWCDEKVRLLSGAYVAGLAVNIGVNLWLLPSFGLWGAVVGTCAAHSLVLVSVYLLSLARGMRFDAGVWAISFLPLALAGGPWIAGATLLAICAVAIGSDAIFSPAEKSQLDAAARKYGARAQKLLRRAPAPLVAALELEEIGNVEA